MIKLRTILERIHIPKNRIWNLITPNDSFFTNDLWICRNDPTLFITLIGSDIYPELLRMTPETDMLYQELYNPYQERIREDWKEENQMLSLFEHTDIWHDCAEKIIIREKELTGLDRLSDAYHKTEYYFRNHDRKHRLKDGELDPARCFHPITKSYHIHHSDWLAFEYSFDENFNDCAENGGRATLYFALEKPEHFILDFNRAFPSFWEYEGWNYTLEEKGTYGRDIQRIIQILHETPDFDALQELCKLENQEPLKLSGTIRIAKSDEILKIFMLPE